ncbi:hypothetical protein MKW92_037470 [Papaver armeniacum]|nr:hypothetical protein MKW92_037470 [Papaver armeniacum]
MIIDTTELQAINSFFRLESLKGVYGLIWLLVPIFTPVLGITIGILVIVWLERKISAWGTTTYWTRIRGPLGILQALADGTKLLFKEDLLPSRGDILFIHYSVIPFGYRLVLADLSIGVFLWISISSIAPIGLLMSGYGSNNKYSFWVVYELLLNRLAQSKYGFWGWNLWRQPIGFAVFVISSLAECERLPFDLPEAEEELVAGYQTEYSVLYLGGWNLSLPYIFLPHFEIYEVGGVFGMTIGIFITLAKAYLFLFIPITTRWTLPRMRMDQLLNLGWKFLLPISLGNLLLTTSFQLFSL